MLNICYMFGKKKTEILLKLCVKSVMVLRYFKILTIIKCNINC